MICDDARPLLHADLDGELDLNKSLAVEEHVNTCAECARERANLRSLRTAFGNRALYYDPPAKLERQVRAALRRARRAERIRSFDFRSWSWAGAAAAVFILAVIVVKQVHFGAAADDLITSEVVDDHLRSLAQNHLTDVLSSNQHTVKPWFDGRLSFTPPVKDLVSQGFPLVGGRLDYLENRPVAAIVYRRRQHIINLFVSPVPGATDSQPFSEKRVGYNIVGWTESGMKYWAVSSLNAAELAKFAHLVRNQ
ncbi:MAG TPA: anti-sigma factor [Candidatus Binataceae bacterium]|nr:anti-sigma factor [Candidatus Binataceae bacterium]